MAITLELTKKALDANLHANGMYTSENNHQYFEYLVSKEVYDQLCPKQYQNGKVWHSDLFKMKASDNRLLLVNKTNNERLSVTCI
jgi:hypothetical protein